MYLTNKIGLFLLFVLVTTDTLNDCVFAQLAERYQSADSPVMQISKKCFPPNTEGRR